MANAGNGVDDFITPAIYLEILKQGEQIGHPTAQQSRPQLAAAPIFRFSSASRACPGMLTRALTSKIISRAIGPYIKMTKGP